MQDPKGPRFADQIEYLLKYILKLCYFMASDLIKKCDLSKDLTQDGLERKNRIHIANPNMVGIKALRRRMVTMTGFLKTFFTRDFIEV